MAVCYARLPPLSSTQSILGGCRTVRLINSSGNEFITADKKVSLNIRNAGCYLQYFYNYGSNAGGHANRLKYKNSKCCANTEVAEAEDNSSICSNTMTPIEQLKLLYAFTRPYACIGMIYCFVSSSLIAIQSLSDISLPFFIGLLKAATALGCILVYGNTVNQIFDLEIDKVNKPYLPIASGKMKLETAISISSSFAVMGFAIGISIGSIPLLWGIFLNFLLLSAYSVELPFLRWKKSAVSAAICIIVCYAIVHPVSTYLHMQTFILCREANFPKSLAFGSIVMSAFFFVVSLFKDIPDIEGDRKFGVRTLASLLGQKKVFWICVYIIQMAYTFAIFLGATSSYKWSKLIIIASHVVLSLTLWKRAKSINYEDKNAMQSFYMFIWNLISVEFLLIPLVR